MEQTSLYLHVPFCRKRCPYCDFNTYSGLERWMPDYVAALCREIEVVAAHAKARIPVHTVFYGGGTPSLLSPAQLEQITATLARNFDMLPGLEMSLEANPGTLSLEYLKTLRGMGFNRLSLGVQSFDAEELQFLGRIHDARDVLQAVAWARQAGFDNLSLDLIFGLPEQIPGRWQNSLETALSLEPDHLSLYSLIVEDGTLLKRWVERGLVSLPDDDLAADQYDYAEERLERAGFGHYEISNWARPGRAARHNLQYWRNLPYLGFGAGAHGYAAGVRYSDVRPVRRYIDLATGDSAGGVFPASPAQAEAHPVDRTTEMLETMMVGLRLLEEGVSEVGFSHRFGAQMESVFGEQIERLSGMGLLEKANGCVRLTPRGHLLGNRVFREFV